MKTVAFVPIRLNSSRVAGKNLRPLGGRPLMTYILETLRQVENIDRTYVYCSDPTVAQLLPEGVQLLRRDAALDSDTTLGEQIYDAFTREVEADIYVLAHATSPFIRPETIAQAVARVQSGEYDSAFSAERIQTFAVRRAAAKLLAHACAPARRSSNRYMPRRRPSSSSDASCGADATAA